MTGTLAASVVLVLPPATHAPLWRVARFGTIRNPDKLAHVPTV
jgi:hypothetical protein